MLRQYRPVDHGSVAGEGDQQIDIGCEEQSRLGGQNIAGKIAEWRTNNLDAVSLACGEQGDVGTPVGAGEPFAARCDNRTATMGRSAARRVGKGWVSTCRYRCSPYH